MYQVGRGVPKDEGKARHLVDVCVDIRRTPVDNTLAEEVGCSLLLSRMRGKGWAGPVDADGAKTALQQARLRPPQSSRRALSDADLFALYR